MVLYLRGDRSLAVKNVARGTIREGDLPLYLKLLLSIVHTRVAINAQLKYFEEQEKSLNPFNKCTFYIHGFFCTDTLSRRRTAAQLRP